jgi:endoglucanase
MDLRLIRQNFTNVPLIIGEWAASPVATESAARWKYFDFFTQTAAKYDTATVLWDNGDDFLDRGKGVWRDAVAKDIYINAAKGVKNSLPESTEDTKAITQETSAYLFHRVGQAVGAQTISFQLNGNTIKGAKLEGGASLQTPADYTVEGPSIKFSISFLGRYFSPTVRPGIKASLIIEFSAGADSQVELVQWDVPKLNGGASSKAAKEKDLRIPISWEGIPKVAAVKAVLGDGKYLVDDWTRWLGPLQQARAVSYSSSFVFDTKQLT